MSLLEHFTLATTTGAFVHDRHYVIIRCNDLDSGTVICHPTFAFPQTQQHPVNTLLGAWAGIEIVRE